MKIINLFSLKFLFIVLLFFSIHSTTSNATCIIVICANDTIYMAIDTRVNIINNLTKENYFTTASKLLKVGNVVAAAAGFGSIKSINIDSIIVKSLMEYEIFDDRTTNVSKKLLKTLDEMTKNSSLIQYVLSSLDTLNIYPVIIGFVNGKSRVYRLMISLYKNLDGKFEIVYNEDNYDSNLRSRTTGFFLGPEKPLLDYMLNHPNLPIYTEPINVLKELMKVAIKNDCMCGYPIEISRLTKDGLEIIRYNEDD